MEITIQHWLIPPYAICFLSSFILNYCYIAYELRKCNMDRKYIAYSVFLTAALTLYCGAVYTIATQYISSGTLTGCGFSSLGGMIGMLLGVWIFTRIYKEHTREISTTYIVSLGLIYSVSKLGCFFAGCCYGIAYNGIFHVRYIDQGLETIARVPVQLIESVLFLAAFLGMNLLHKRNQKVVVTVSLLTYSVLKFTLDFLRYYENRKGLSGNQIVCAVTAVLVILLAWKHEGGEKR